MFAVRAFIGDSFTMISYFSRARMRYSLIILFCAIPREAFGTMNGLCPFHLFEHFTMIGECVPIDHEIPGPILSLTTLGANPPRICRDEQNLRLAATSERMHGLENLEFPEILDLLISPGGECL
ncbi:MAG: hypothetical protein COT73_04910 [Bdellovibrio sp. CG10_big_fil_rev_8_21_14_0_10_47_8]|nr:MAG: hypothetical protein COT73_04910 [Bdellovibrio sp. CG10_big_fil_rev_8_21_14_0_10_47_8]